MKLKHAVITSVDRDDLPDGGANHWANTIREVKKLNPETTLEVLIPDFDGKTELLDMVIAEKPNIISHNLETVRRLTPQIRTKAKYETSLQEEASKAIPRNVSTHTNGRTAWCSL
jgi:lipoic acid synthetase